jgi:PAS domain S-box-containing protein
LIARKRNDKALRDSEERFRMLLEVAPVAIILSRQGGEIISVNRMAEALFDFERQQLEALTLENLIPEHFREISAFFENAQNQAVHATVNMEPYGMRRDGTMFPIQVAISSFRSGSELLALSFILDLTEKMAAQQHEFDLRLEKERSHIMSEFIKDAAHEFRTPLSIIKSSAYLLERVTDEARRETLYANIHSEADSIVELVEGLTTTVRLDRAADSDYQLCDPNNILSAALDTMRPRAAEKDLSLHLRLEENETLMEGNAEDLNLAFHCLLDNALRYTPAGGQIDVRSEQRGAVLVITIRDTGIGMTPEVQASAFERFYRADFAHSTRGFGLGLPIAQKVIQNHRGSIAVDSAPGKGSTFTVILPLKPA